MSETDEIQSEEREALISIYEGDGCFKQINSKTYQYKYGEEDGSKSFLMEITWPEEYPNVLPTINMETFYNRNLSKALKDTIISMLNEEGQNWLGCGMTYTLFEYLKDKVDDLLADESLKNVNNEQIIGTNHQETEKDSSDENDADERGTKNVISAGGGAQKKEHLTKAQKRKQWDRVDNKGNRPRGYDWVDIIKHLSQTGGKPE